MRFAIGLVLCLIAAAAAAQTPAARPALGVSVSDVMPNPQIRGAWVHRVMPGSAASAAGLQPDDIIVGIDGRPIPDAAFLTAYLGARRVGDAVTLYVLRRNGNNIDRLTLTATLGGAVPPSPAATTATAPSPAPAQAPAAGTPAADRVQWVGFTDPNEQAFSTEIPQGWRVVGGIVRRNPVGATPYLRLLSPDRQVYIVVGDPSIAYFTAASTGRPPRPGQVFRDYLSGTDFASDYASRILPAVCGSVTVTGAKDRPDLAQGPWTRANAYARHSGGEATFTCTLHGTPVRGLVVTDTYIYPVMPALGGSLWTADLLAGVMAPPERYQAALAMTVHVVAAWRPNPDWVHSEQAKIDAATRGVNAVTQAMSQYSQQQIATAQRQQHAMMQQSEAFDRILTGSSPYRDAAGNQYQLDNTKTQWIGPGNRIVGTTGAAPGPAWQQLQEVPPQ